MKPRTIEKNTKSRLGPMSRSFVRAGQMVLCYAHCVLYLSSAAATFGSIAVIDAGDATWNGALAVFRLCSCQVMQDFNVSRNNSPGRCKEIAYFIFEILNEGWEAYGCCCYCLQNQIQATLKLPIESRTPGSS